MYVRVPVSLGMYVCMDGWMGGWMDGWMYGWMHACPCV